jgi:UDP-N-acetylglucosamine acyltransferase
MANAIHPTAVIGPEADLGSGNTIGPGVVLLGPLRQSWCWWRSRVRG